METDISGTKRSSFGVFARIRGIPGATDELRRRLHDLTCLTQQEDGCLACEMIENAFDSTEFTLIEKWSNRKAHIDFLGTDRIQVALYSLSDLLSGELDLCTYVLKLDTIRYGTNSYSLAAR